jgi:hypothetical protein
MNLSVFKIATFALVLATELAAGCSSGAPEATRTAGYEVRLGRTMHIRSATYTLTVANAFSASGTPPAIP